MLAKVFYIFYSYEQRITHIANTTESGIRQQMEATDAISLPNCAPIDRYLHDLGMDLEGRKIFFWFMYQALVAVTDGIFLVLRDI